jgi:hypothetical protein
MKAAFLRRGGEIRREKEWIGRHNHLTMVLRTDYCQKYKEAPDD